MMSNRRKPGNQRKKKQRQHSTVADHRRQGKTLTAPINQVGPITAVTWLRDVFPNLLWPCAVLHDSGSDRGMVVIAKAMDRLSPLIAGADEDPDESDPRPAFDGTLHAFDLIPEDRRAEAIELLQVDGLYEQAFPWVLARALQKYPDVPGAWILSGWQGNIQIIPEGRAEAFLAAVVLAAWHGHTEVATRAKALYFRSLLVAGRIRFAPTISFVELLPKYPGGLTDDETAKVEASIRASFNATWNLSEDFAAERSDWAESFWRQNWRLTECHFGGDEPGTPNETGGDESALKSARDKWLSDLADVEQRFLAAVGGADPDLYSPDRNEVLTGITYRQIRAAETMVMYPGLWDQEHGAPFVRALVEARIVHKWLIHRDDQALYEQFKAYGRGHMKLHLLHLREYAESLDAPPDGIEETIASLEEYVNRDLMEEFQDIDLGGNFAGPNTRVMAQEVSLENDYRLVFAPTSADAHGEWMSLEKYALVPCLNPLHRGHRIPNRDRGVQLGPELVDLALSLLNEMVTEYVDAI